jgi:hypothetical protein
MLLGAVLLVLGLLLTLFDKLPGLGRLPGDLVYRKGPLTVYVPLATSLLISVLLTLLLALFRRG